MRRKNFYTEINSRTKERMENKHTHNTSKMKRRKKNEKEGRKVGKE